MTYSFFDLLKDSFEREVASTNYYEHEAMTVSNLTTYGKALAYADILRAIGHTVDMETNNHEHLYEFILAHIDGTSVLEGGL